MELVTMTIAGVAIVLTASLAYAVNKYREIQEKNIEIEALRCSLNAYAETYAFENADEKLVEGCQSKIKELFNGEIEKEFNKYKTVEEKKEFACTVVFALAECMKVNVNDIEFVDLGPNTRGVAIPDSDSITICLNEVLLVADPEQLVKTMCHELKHCVQYKSLTNNIWGYSPQRIAQYLYSWREYVSCDSRESYEAYSKQIIEIDANKYVDRIFNA
ncbi:MAG: hypothetical protein IKV26_03190 [Paludibacteraceae bacterium]|nr:hypothetical protein [Paludibacteraceae bacterium]